MKNRLKFPVLILLITALALMILSSCTSVGIASLQVKEDCDYVTEYVIGDELDLTGLELVVTRTDGETYTILATDVRKDLKVMNFDTSKAVDTLNVIIEYKGVATSIVVKVVDRSSASLKYTVSFSTGEGERVEPIMAGEFETITAPTDPIRQGYIFDGWYKQSTCNDKWDFNIDKVVEDTTLYAKWSKLYNITFHFSEEYNTTASGEVIPNIVKEVKAGGSLVDVPALPHVEGMVGNWSRTTFTDIYSNIDVYAEYSTATYKVVFFYMDADGVTPFILKTFENVPHGTNLAEEYADEIADINVHEFSADGTKHFAKWSQSFTEIVSDLNIEALYEINKYSVSFMYNYKEEGASEDKGVFDTKTGITYNNPVNRPAEDPVRSGYVFDGWYKNPQCDEGYAWNFDTDRVKAETKIYAKWTRLYYVKFYVDGDLYQTIEVREHGNATKAPLPVREGYSASWYINDTPLNDDALQNVIADKRIDARFTILSYTVTFYNYDREEIDTQEVEYGSSAVRPTEVPKRLGYRFVSWGALKEGSESVAEREYEYKNIKMDTEITARFEADTYQIIVVPNVAGQESSYALLSLYDALIGSYDNETASKLDLKYDGHNFDGWYTDSAWTKPWNLGANVLNVDSLVKNTPDQENQTTEQKRAEVERKFASNSVDNPNVVLTLYAKWSKIHTILVYDASDIPCGSLNVINGEYLDAQSLPKMEDKEGMTQNWYIRGEEDTPFDFTQPIFSDLALKIGYKTNVYTVTFYTSIGEIHGMPIQVEHNGKIQGSIADPVVEGKKFVGWDKSLDIIIVEDTDFFANFVPIYLNVTWNYNGKNYAITSVEYGKPAVYPADVELPVREGYTLTSWKAPAGYDIKSVKSDMTVSPEWSINTYTIEFKDKETNNVYLQYDGEAYQENQIKSHGSAIDVDATVPNPEKVGKDFTGWSIGSLRVRYDGDLFAWVLDSEYGIDGTLEISSSEVSLIIMGDKYFYSYETPAYIKGMLDTGWNEELIFEIRKTASGWQDVKTGNIVVATKGIAFTGHLFYTVISDTVLYSNHTTSIYEVSYETNTDTTIDAVSYEYGAVSRKPSQTIEKEGYVFIGWYLEPEFKNKYTFGSPVMNDIVLYARWEEKRVYTEHVNYALNEEGTAYTLMGLGAGFNATELIVANFYGDPGLPVDSIGAEALAGNNQITSISLPNTIINIGPGAFMNMSALKSIEIPTSVTIIPDNAFNGATALETVSFGDYPTVTTLGSKAFANNVSLKYSIVNGVKKAFTLPESIRIIGSGAFLNCTALTEIVIPASVTDIGSSAFAGANSIRYAIFVRNTPANLAENVFQNYTSLQNAFRIYTPNIAMYTSASVSENWKLLKDKIYDLNNIVYSGNNMEWSYTLDANSNPILVQYLGSQTDVTIPQFISVNSASYRVSKIGDYAFDGRTTSVAFDAIVGISPNTFASTEVLTNLSITVGSENNINTGYLFEAYSNVASLHTLSVSPNVTISGLFGGAAPTALTTVKTLAGSNNTMSPAFMANCGYVKEVIISGRTENVSEDAFYGCTALERVVFDNTIYTSLATIGANAFNGAKSLAEFEILTSGGTAQGIPQSVTTIGANAFDGTSWLDANSADMIIVGNGILYRYSGSQSIVAIPSTVTAITANAFNSNAKLRQVYIEDIANSKLATIGASAFANCVNLESITLPASLKSIGTSAFENDDKLASVISFGLGEPSSIGAYAFSNTHRSMKVYISDIANNWSSAYTCQKLSNLALFESNDNTVWVYADAIGGSGIIIVKALGEIGGNTSLTVPEQLNSKDVYEIADYALPRIIKNLDYSLYIMNVGVNPFGGVTFLEEITLRNSYSATRVQPSAMMSLFTQNGSVATLNMVSTIAISELLGGTLPQNVKTVNVLANSNVIAEGFLENNTYVENITITLFDKDGEAYVNPVVVDLEDTAQIEKEHRFVTIGAKAFRNTAWMNAYDGEYVVVLGGNLVDYKGANSVLEIPNIVESINGSIFENDEFIEVVTIPASVNMIGDRAFNGATNLTKIFIENTTAPIISAETFDITHIVENGVEIFVPESSSGYNVGTWYGLTKTNSGIIRIKNQVSTNVYEEYIVNKTTGELLLSRRYAVTYSGTLVSEILENTTAIAPTRITDKSTGLNYDVVSLGNNVFMSAVQNVVVELSHAINEFTFKNLGDIDTVTIRGTSSIATRALSGADIVDVFNTHNVLNVAFDGAVTLTDIMGTTGGLNALVGVKILDGVTTTVPEMLKGWTEISSVIFPESIEQVGINSLEDTAWYNDYTSTVYGNDFVVLGGSLLYKYKGSANTIVVPAEVEIINVGAFSSCVDDVWSSSLRVKQVRFESGSNAHTILDNAFNGCAQLNSILLPNSMRHVAQTAFDNTGFGIVDGMLIVSEEGASGRDATLVRFVGDESNLPDGTLTIPSNVKKIASGAFRDVTFLKKITYTSDSILTTICEDAFNGATALETLQLPSSVVSIGKNAFYNTLWFGKELNKGVDVVIGKVLYQRVTTGSIYTLYDNVISIVEDALVPIEPFTIGDVVYSTLDGVKATAFYMENGSKLPQKELYSILSKEWMTTLRTNGQVTLSGLIGSDEKLENITNLSFLAGIKSIIGGYAEGWSSVTQITNIPATVTEIGENAFRGTTWFENQNMEGFNFAGESKVIIKYVGDGENVVIGSYAGEVVTGITADAFKGNENIKSVTFGEYSTVSKIPAGAFRDCVNLETIVFNDYVTDFGEDAFTNTAWLNGYDSDFVIVDGVMIAYKGEGGAITIPSETTKINSYVFRGNSDITSVLFDENCLMSEIEPNTFRDCVNLEEIIINEYIVKVDRSAVQGTAWLSQTSQSNSPILYYENTYYGIRRAVLYVGTAQVFTIPNTVTEIMPTAFSGVDTLQQIIFGEGKLTVIPDSAFEGCTSLEEVTLSSAIVEIGENAFAGTPWIAKQEGEFIVKNGILIRYNGTSLNVVIPENVTLIEKGVFDGSGIVSIDMSGANIPTILEDTFNGLTTLQDVVFSSSTTYVGQGAFAGTAYLSSAPDGLLIVNEVALIAYKGENEEVTIPSGVSYLNSDVFQGNSFVKSVTFEGQIEIAPYAFVGTGLTTIVGEQYITKVGACAFDGTHYEEVQVNNGFIIVNGYLVEYQGSATEIVIPASVEYIPEGVFTGNTNITSVDFSAVSGTLEIEENAFRNAVNLKNIVFSDNIDYIGNRAFYNTAWMESYADALIITENGKLLAYVGEGSVVSIPRTVKTFARNVFAGNTNITSVYFATGSNLEIPSEAFKDCTSLLNISFSGSTFQIGENAFQNTEWYKEEAKKTANKGFIVVNGLLIGYEGTSTEIEILSKITHIYDYVFKGNENITSLSFASGSGLTSIKGETFVGCTQLANVTFHSNLVELDMGAFEGTAWRTNLTTDFIVVGTKLLAYVGVGGDVVIPSGVGGNSILEISPNVFQGNESITSISFGDGSYLSAIPANAFKGCTNLAKVVFPEDIYYVGSGAFEGTKWLENLESGILAEGETGIIENNGYVLNGKLLFYFGVDENYYLLDSTKITYIASGAFENTTVAKFISRVKDPTRIEVASGAFDSVIGIYVQSSLIDTYISVWSEYALKIFDVTEM